MVGGTVDPAALGGMAVSAVLYGIGWEATARPAVDPGPQEVGQDAGLCLHPASWLTTRIRPQVPKKRG